MGRRPDVLIATYFTRGDKLQDASNRYSFTCKGCGTLFPKGRTSHLTDHLTGETKRCPALTSQDDASIAAIRAAKSSEKAQRTSTKRPAAYSFLEQDISGPVPRKRQAIRVSGGDNSFSGLEALAEASRQVEWPSKQQSSWNAELDGDGESNALVDPHLKGLPTLFEPHQSSASELSTLAVSASNLEESLHTPTDVSMPDDEMPQSEILNTTSDTLSEQLREAAYFHIPIAAKPMMDLFQTKSQSTPGKSLKARSKFSPSRREEVRDVRSKRACIRCRMLRKPCSSDDPCTRCSAIKNPRLWSSKCTRGRLADVCDLYSARIYMRSIKSILLSIQLAHNIANHKDTLIISNGKDQNSTVKLEVTALHRIMESGEMWQVPECYIPVDLGYRECELIRNLIAGLDIETYPKEIQRLMAWGQQLTIEAEIQMFHQAISLYRCTRFLVMPSKDLHLSLLGNVDTELVPLSNSSSTTSELLSLAFRSMIEYVAQEDCHALLKTMEQALVNRTFSNASVLAAAMLLFFSLELLQYHFYTQQHLLDSQTTPSLVPAWTPHDSPATWATKLDHFSSFMQDLLRCRHIISELEISTTGRLEVSAATADTVMREFFVTLDIDATLLSKTPTFVPDDPDSLYFKHIARMLVSSQTKELKDMTTAMETT